MWFKNLRVAKIQPNKNLSQAGLIDLLAKSALSPALSLEAQASGWVSPREQGQLVECVGKQFLIALGHEKKLLPTSVINQFAKARAAEVEEQQGFKPGRKQMKEIKEEVTDTLMPRAFVIPTKTFVWIDAVNGWLVINAASAGKSDDVIKHLLKAELGIEISAFNTERSPMSAMTQWLANDEAPSGFTIDSNTELRSSAEGNPKVRYVNHTLETQDVRQHIAAGKQCTSLAMTWNDRVSFVLTEDLTIKKVDPLDVLKETAAASNEDERFEGDFTLMTGELNNLLAAIVESLGGLCKAQ